MHLLLNPIATVESTFALDKKGDSVLDQSLAQNTGLHSISKKTKRSILANSSILYSRP